MIYYLDCLRVSMSSNKNSFFDGWFVRIIDHNRDFSCGVIMGSLRLPGSDAFDQHYLCISYASEIASRLPSAVSRPPLHIWRSAADVGREQEGRSGCSRCTRYRGEARCR